MTDTSYDRTIKLRQSDDKKKLIAVLKELPIILAACTRVNISRDTYYRWRHNDAQFRKESSEALSQGIEFLNDLTEGQLVALIKKEKLPAISMWLKHNHPRYGGKSIRNPNMSMPELTPLEKKIFKEFLAPSAPSAIIPDHGKET